MSLFRAWTTLLWLSFRRLLWSGSTLMVMLPLSALGLFLLRCRFWQQESSFESFNDFSLGLMFLFASFVVPICAVAYATASIGGDREDRTLLFLLVCPVPRPLIFLAKFLATLPLVLGLVIGGVLRLLPARGRDRAAGVCALSARYFLHGGRLRQLVPFFRRVVPALDDHCPDLFAVHGIAAGQHAGHREARGHQLLWPLDDVRRRRSQRVGAT